MKKVIVFSFPLLFIMEVLLFNLIVDLLRQKSDVAVLLGVIIICISILGNYYLGKNILKQFKEKTK